MTTCESTCSSLAKDAAILLKRPQNSISVGSPTPRDVKRASPSFGLASTITGFGMPFANAENAQVEGWVNENKPIINNLTLLDVLQQRIFYIVIDYPLTYAQNKLSEDLLLPPFSYPYGTEQRWNVENFKDLIKTNKGRQFEAAYRATVIMTTYDCCELEFAR